ncbi:hypothetical protein N9N01_02450 [Candidatus Actinomarina sp.]|nr:hypothetical protein [Candidatus Actinomarina sp.]
MLIPLITATFFMYFFKRGTSDEFLYAFIFSFFLSSFLFINLREIKSWKYFEIKSLLLNNLYSKFQNNHKSQILIIFLFLLISQNDILNYETIDTDINSYLATSKEILRGNLPYENQWESKTPMLYVFYAFLIFLSGGNLVYFKLLNDLLLFLVALLIFYITKIKYENIGIKAFTTTCLYVSFMSFDWAKTEYSEIYVIFFLASSYLYLLRKSSNNVFKAGLLFSIATLVNQGSIVFAIPFLFVIFKRAKNIGIEIIKFSLGVLIPHFLMLLFYLFNDLFDIYYATLFKIPLTYTQSDFLFLEEILVFVKSIYNHSFLLFFIFFASVIFLMGFFTNLNLWRNSKNNIFTLDHEINLFLLTSLLFYYLAAKGYYHHTLFLIFFSVFIINQFTSGNFSYFFNFTIFICSCSIILSTASSSLNNLKNLNEVENNYPLKELSIVIDSYFDDDFTVLALDYNLILYYLDKPNFSYIVHPQNHYEDFITNELINLDLIKDNQIRELISAEPDVILCSGTQIISGIVTQIEEFNCEVSDYNRKYIKLDTNLYRYNANINLYPDPYREVGVYLKIND